MTVTVSVLLVRHGESTWNAVGRWQGQADPPLSERGRAQARVTDVPEVGLIVASDLDRARETAGLLAARAPRRLAVEIDPRLRERDAGAFSGLTRTEIHERFPGLLPDDPARPADGSGGPAGLIPPPGWEPDETVIARAWQSLEELARRIREAEASAALAVTHSGLIYAVERDLGAARARIANLEGRWVHRGPTGWSLGDRHLLVDPTRADVTRPDAL